MESCNFFFLKVGILKRKNKSEFEKSRNSEKKCEKDLNVILWCSMKHQRIYQSRQDLSSEELDCCGGETKNVSEIKNSPGLLLIFSYKSTVPPFYSKHVSDWLTAE